MFEMRWVEFGVTRQLEYRFITPCVDASGCLCPGGTFSDWKVVPIVSGEDAAYEDVRASSGIAGAP